MKLQKNIVIYKMMAKNTGLIVHCNIFVKNNKKS